MTSPKSAGLVPSQDAPERAVAQVLHLLDRAALFLAEEIPSGPESHRLACDLRFLSEVCDLPHQLARCAYTASGHVELVSIARANHLECGDAEHSAQLSGHIADVTGTFRRAKPTIRGAA